MRSADTAASLLDGSGVVRELGAFVVAAAFDRAGGQAAFALGDGTLRIARLDDAEAEWTSVQAHEGAVLSLAPGARGGFVSGGDDGRFVQVDAAGELRELASFGGKWVEHAASFADAKTRVMACAAGRTVQLFDANGAKLRALQHPSTVTGIAFDARRGKRIVASHYNGASLWFVGSSAPAPRSLAWKGSHIGVAIHPAADAVVTAMQENALHGWRLPDGHDMRMSGYPAKPLSLDFSSSGRYLASSGADLVVLWPFFGGGPMGKLPIELAPGAGALCTRVAFQPGSDEVAAGFADGGIVLAEVEMTGRVGRIAAPGRGSISALAWDGRGDWLAFGTEQGCAGLVRIAGSFPYRPDRLA